MSEPNELRGRLTQCRSGHQGWNEFEDACLDTLRFLFVPPLIEPIVQPRSYSGIDRRDAVFPNRNLTGDTNWARLYQELSARMILIEFKNYDRGKIGKEEANQTRNYLTKPMGRLAIMCCNKLPDKSAHQKRNSIFSEDGKLILFVTTKHLIEMIAIKERGEDPSDLIMDMVERFYLQHE